MPKRSDERPTTDPRQDPKRGAVMRTLGDELVAIRGRLGMTQTELGEHIGVGKSQISKIEKGLNNVNFYEVLLVWDYIREEVDGGPSHPLVAAAERYLHRRPRRSVKGSGDD